MPKKRRFDGGPFIVSGSDDYKNMMDGLDLAASALSVVTEVRMAQICASTGKDLNREQARLLLEELAKSSDILDEAISRINEAVGRSVV